MAEISGGVFAAPIISRDMEYGGIGMIAGTTKIKNTPSNTPVSRKVRVFDHRAGKLIRETWSAPVTGAFSFQNIDPERKYLVVSQDHTADYNAVVADIITPVVV